MAEGGGYFGYEDPDLDNAIDHDDDDDDEQEVDTTTGFSPGGASTPYHGGEEQEMQTMQHEQSGLPDTSFDEEETSFGGERSSIDNLFSEHDLRQKMKKAIDMIKAKFSRANFAKIKIRRGSGKNKGKIVAVGSKGGEYKILKDDESDFMKSFLDGFKQELGQRSEEIIAQENESIKENRQRLKEAESQLRQAERNKAQKEKAAKELQDLRNKIRQVDAKLDAIQEEQGSNIKSEAEVHRLRQLKKNLQTDFENKKKAVTALEKQAKNKEKEQSQVDRLRARIAAEESERNTMEERLNNIKTLDELKERIAELQRKNEEDKAVIQDENTSPSDKEEAEERVAERNEELTRVQTQIEERERALPLRERVKAIFKKYGFTVTAVIFAAGAIIGTVTNIITNALTATAKTLGNGLKEIGKKVASILPGLLGSIVSFLFKTAGQAIGFLAKNAWLLILVVVAFVMETYIKKKR